MSAIVPADLSDVDVVFPARVSALLPKWEDIPKAFKDGDTPENEIISRWFFSGLSKPLPFKVKDGVDEAKAMRHLKACLGSFEPKHEHKEAGCAYLLHQWFDLVVEASK